MSVFTPPQVGGSFAQGKMVKLGNNFSEKNNGKVVSEDGFDTIPLITPLDASQLQFPPPDKVRYHSEPGGFVFCCCGSVITISPIKQVKTKEN